MAQQEYLHSKSYLVSAREGLVLPKAFKSAVEAIDFSRANNLVQRGYNIVMKGGDVIRTLKSGRIKEAPHMGETIGRGEDGKVPQTASKAVSESTMREFRRELRKLPVWKLNEIYNNLKERKVTGIAILDKHRGDDFNLVLHAVNEALWERGRLPQGELKDTSVVPMAYQFFPESVRKSLPRLGATEGQKDPVVQVKFFTPWSNWTWYATEFDGDDEFFGWVVGFEKEFGYFLLSELQSVTSPLGLKIERDIYFEPQPLSQVMAKHGESLPMTIPKETSYKEYTPKPAWQMTREEYYKPVTLPRGWKNKGYKPIIQKAKGAIGRLTAYIVRVITPDGETLYPADHLGVSWSRAKHKDDHRMKVKDALERGLPVPPQVLADYPDLQPRRGGPTKLPEFQGYTVDKRLREFRKLEYGKTVEFIPFDSPKGRELLQEMDKFEKATK